MVNDEFLDAYLKCPYKAYLIKLPSIQFSLARVARE